MKKASNIIFALCLITILVWATLTVEDAFSSLLFNATRKGAINGYVEDQRRLGQFYHKGMFTEVDLEKAKKWYRKAAGKGNMTAIDILDSEFNERSTQNAR